MGMGEGDAHGEVHGDHVAPTPQAQMTKLREEMSLRFLKREAKLCSFLQKSFLALEKVGACRRQGNQSPSPQLTAGGVSPQRMKASESARLRAESSLREELESKWQQLRELDAERTRALQGQRQVGGMAGTGTGGAPAGAGQVSGCLCPAAGRVPPPGAVSGPGQSCGPADRVRASEPSIAEPHPAGRAEGLVGV